MINLWPLLLPAAAWSGWYFAIKNYPKDEQSFSENQLTKEYVIGLNYLLNEQPDKAVDVFIKLLQIDSETIETHLALGTLFRRRGEVDRAIRIHQNLIARPKLSPEDRHQALMALAQDYMSAGLFDRAEKIFNDVLSIYPNDLTALYGLISIYQNEANWLQAIDVAKNIQKITETDLSNTIANFYCELATLALKSKSFSQAQEYLELAIGSHKNCARCYILQAEYLATNQSNYEAAIEALKKALNIDAAVILEVINPLVKYHTANNIAAQGIEFLKNLKDLKLPLNPALHIIAEHIEKHEDSASAMQYLLDNLHHTPSFKGMNKLLKYLAVSAKDDKLDYLMELTNKLITNKFTYRCKQCGFASKNIHWCCPGCKQWNTLKPIYGVESF